MIQDKVRDEKLQYDNKREIAKTSILPTDKNEKYE